MIDQLVKKLVGCLEDNGHHRPAVMLQHPNKIVRDRYLVALLQPEWEFDVRGIIGHLYDECKPEAERIRKSLGPTVSYSYFNCRRIDFPNLEIENTTRFSDESIEQAREIFDKLFEVYERAHRLIYKDVLARSEQDPDLLYHAFGDDIIGAIRDTSQYNIEDYERRLRKNVDGLERGQIDLGYLAILCGLLGESDRKMDYSMLILDESTEEELNAFEAEKEEQDLFKQRIILKARTILSDRDRLQTSFDGYIEKKRSTPKEEIIKKARRILERTIGSPDLGFLIENPLNQDEVNVSYHVYTGSGCKAVPPLMKTPLKFRENILEEIQLLIDKYSRKLTGIQQLIGGGQQTNEFVHPSSTLQNNARFPNIGYSAEILDELQTVASELRDTLDTLPDMTDLATKGQLRRKNKLIYSIQELPKNPLDVSFGNDSACCIFVPNDPTQFQNGYTVPFYQTNNAVHLFATHFHRTKTKRDRMGLIVGLDAYEEGNQHSRYLVANSLELSRNGIAGGKATIVALSNYEQEWLIEYAKQNGYDGVVMGSHGYNTAQNYATQKGDTLETRLVFAGGLDNVHTDVFMREGSKLVTKPKSCYWLWKK